MWPSWGWLRHRPPDMLCLGRPLVVTPGDILDIAEADGEPPMTFLVLDELIPLRDETALRLLGYELDAAGRVLGGRRELYVRHPQDIEAVVPRWRVSGLSQQDWDGLGEDDRLRSRP